MSDYFRFVIYFIDREIRVGYVGFLVWLWKYFVDFIILKFVFFLGVGYDLFLDFLRIFVFVVVLNWVCRFCVY